MKEQTNIKGKYTLVHKNSKGEILGTYEAPNSIATVGMNYILDAAVNGGTQDTTLFMGLVDNASFTAFANADLMSSHAGWIENTDYDEATRPEWTAGAAAARAVTNSSPVVFTISATVTIKGVFIVLSTGDSTKGATTGILLSTTAFASTVTANDNDTFNITYTISG